MKNLFDKLPIPVKKIVFGKGFFHLFGSFGADDLKICRDKTIKNNEAYRLKIRPEGIEIFASADAGAFYGVQTLKDLITIYGGKLPVCTIKDEPDFKRRGVYLDCSRGKVPTVKTIKELIERLAHWKINELQLYIENVFTFKKHPDIGKGSSPFTPREILEIQDCCKLHHINFVGSLAGFGHFEKILSLPKYRHLGEMPGFRGFPAGTTLCPTNPDSVKLVDELYSEFMPLFEAKDFNVCCDETLELGRGKSKKQADRIGTGRVYLNYILKIHRLCKKYGKRMNLWADIVLQHPELLKKLPKDIVLLNWEYEQDGENIRRTKEIAKAGLRFMVCPGTSGWLTHGSRLQNAMGNIKKFAEQGRKYRADGLLNTDWGDNGHRNFLAVSLHGFAYGAAQSWNGKAVNDTQFTDNFCFHIFGQRTKQMARAIKILGSSYIISGVMKNKCLLYQTLVEPVIGKDIVKIAKTAGLKKIIKRLSDKKLWPKSIAVKERFERLAFEEFKLAAKMDVLAAKRTLAAKVIKTDFSTKDMQKIAKQFSKLWLARNKPSRLKDNLRLFQKVCKGSK
jgi:hexosaminidase